MFHGPKSLSGLFEPEKYLSNEELTYNVDVNNLKETDFDYVNTMLSHHFISMYGKQFLAYKNGVMKPKDFDKDATEADIKNVPLNFTVFDENDLFYYENSFFYR